MISEESLYSPIHTRTVLKILAFTLLVFCQCAIGQAKTSPPKPGIRREVAITFDDLPGVEMPSDKCDLLDFQQRNKKLISVLAKNHIPAIGFVVENRLCEEKRSGLPALLSLWLDAGLKLGNHSFSHFDLNTTPLDVYESDIIRGERTTKELLRTRGMQLEYFRHPYLHTGKDLGTKKALENFLTEHHYRIAPVTIDNQEWMFADVYANAVARRDIAMQRRVGEAYLSYMGDVFEFFEKLSRNVVGYEVKQILLLHDNALNSDYLDRLIGMMRARSYSFITLDEALTDPAYDLPDTYVGTEGVSWLHRWTISKGLKMKQEPREPPWIDTLYKNVPD